MSRTCARTMPSRSSIGASGTRLLSPKTAWRSTSDSGAPGGSTWRARRPPSGPGGCNCSRSFSHLQGRTPFRDTGGALPLGEGTRVVRADVLIVGGGPAGSTCAAVLAAAGRDVLVVDAAAFPRDKPCGGWVTPEVLGEIPFSFASYAEEHVAQSISRFRVGRIDGRAVEVDYGTPVSYGIRRTEFDAYLLRGSGARVVEGERVQTVERRDGSWVLNGTLAAPVLVGAGGHFCPIARQLGETRDASSVVVAREIEFRLSGDDASRCGVEQDRPELYFCADLRGYGWCFRKEDYLNVGLGRLDSVRLPAHLSAFLEFLRRERRVGGVPKDGWRGHAYVVRQGPTRRMAGDGFV